ncbi:MAG: hypothetical protein ACYDEN_09690, partial [Acidimicrobiales bacterium]
AGLARSVALAVVVSGAATACAPSRTAAPGGGGAHAGPAPAHAAAPAHAEVPAPQRTAAAPVRSWIGAEPMETIWLDYREGGAGGRSPVVGEVRISFLQALSSTRVRWVASPLAATAVAGGLRLVFSAPVGGARWADATTAGTALQVRFAGTSGVFVLRAGTPAGYASAVKRLQVIAARNEQAAERRAGALQVLAAGAPAGAPAG